MREKGKVTQWRNDRGFGFIQANNEKGEIFFHENFLLNQSKRPIVGDEVAFEIVTTPEGKKRAERIVLKGEYDPIQRDKILDVVYIFLSLLFLVTIGFLVLIKKIDPIFLIFYCFFSVLTFFVYWWDKVKSKIKEWRTPENTLHFLAFIGGWPGALIAQRVLHHKSRKKSFLICFYATLVLNMAAVVFYHISGSDFLRYDRFFSEVQQRARHFLSPSENAAAPRQKGPIYSWINQDGKRVYSNTGFPAKEPYRDGRIEWQ